MADENNPAPDAPVATIAQILKHPNWATLDVRDEDDKPFGDEGALVNISAEPYVKLLDRGLIILAPETAPQATPAKTGK